MGIFDGFRKRTAKVQASPPMREHLPYTQWQVGDMLKNRYQVYSILGGPGRSGMGIVYICYDHQMREAVAVKTFQVSTLVRELLLNVSNARRRPG
jgi:serine/threonine protein kinase